MTREDSAELIADFCRPLGPEVFAGYATGIQQRRGEWGDNDISFAQSCLI